MDVLRKISAAALCAALVAPALAFASGEDLDPEPHDLAVKAQQKFLCHSAKEYIATLKFLRESKDFVYPDKTSQLVAEKVSRGCDGAAERFSKVLILLKEVGLSDPGALALALDFSSRTADVQKNFLEIFTRTFLTEFFDYDYNVAIRIAFELSKDYKGDPAQVRDDFIELVKYCKDGKTLDMPNRVCAEYVVKLAKLSQYFPDGVREPFYKLFHQLRESHEFGLDMKTALEVSYDVLKSGPTAPDNFYEGFRFAIKKDGLALPLKPALTFAVKMADRSFIGGETPPPIKTLEPEPAKNDVATP